MFFVGHANLRSLSLKQNTGLGVDSLPAIAVLRLVRVFKMVRLFTKARSLRMLINALVSSLLPVLNAFAILFLVSSIYAVVATDLYRSRSEFFTDFANSLYSLFQIATGDAWSSQIVRPLLDEFSENKAEKTLTALFFVSYVMIVGVVLMNIVIAVLLNDFISMVEHEKAEARHQELERKEKERLLNSSGEGPLDKLITGLLNFTTQDDLRRRIFNLYQRLDLDDSGAIDLNELNAGLRKLDPNGSAMHLSQDDFNVLTNGRALLNEDGEVTPSNFETMMLTQIKGYSHRKIQAALARAMHDGSEVQDVVYGLKIIMASVDHMEAMHELLSRDAAGHMKSHLKSKKAVLNKLFRRPLVIAIERWKEHHFQTRMIEEDTETPLLGHVWKNVGTDQPASGTLLMHPGLAAALLLKHQSAGGEKMFHKKEWEELGIHDLRAEHYVMSGSSFYKPVEPNPDEQGGWEGMFTAAAVCV